jgi:N-acetylglucosamine kinase-like BadF-type ATPase
LVRGPVASACLGLAGAGRLQEQGLIEDWARGRGLASALEVTTDVALLLGAGTPEGWGLAVVAGTGSIAHGLTPDGRTARAGGWGHLLGDEGSAYWLAVAGLRAVAAAADGDGPQTCLTPRLLGALGLTEPQDLIPTVYADGYDRAALAALAPLVLSAAAEDAVAAEIVDGATRALAGAAAAVARRLGWVGAAVPLALGGGVFLGNADYCRRFLAALEAAGVRAAPVALVPEPAEGAVRLAAAGVA